MIFYKTGSYVIVSKIRQTVFGNSEKQLTETILTEKQKCSKITETEKCWDNSRIGFCRFKKK